MIYVASILLALLIGMLVLFALGENPFEIYGKIFSMGIIGKATPGPAIMNFIKSLVPLMLTSVGLSLAFKMKFWNIGGEGQFIMGAMAASAVIITVGDKLPDWLTLILMVAAAGLAAGVYGLIPALLKVKFGTNETLLTLMLNYIALYLISFFMDMAILPIPKWNIFLDPNGLNKAPQTFKEIMGNIPLGDIKISYSLIFTVIICVIVHFYITRTKQGYELTVVGDSPNTAKYAGMKVGKIVIRTVFISAMLIGVAAAFKVSSTIALSKEVTASVGWTGVVVAWLSRLNTFGIMITSTLITALRQGCNAASMASSAFNESFADMLQGIILFCVLAGDFLARFKIVVRKKVKEEQK